MVLSTENPCQEIKKRGRKPKKVPLVAGREARKANFIKKIIDGHKQTQAKSFDKRRPTLMKKALELQTLCDLEVCVVCFSPDGNVDVWPEDEVLVKDLIFKYKGLDEKKKKESNYLDFLESKKMKLQNKKEKMMKLKTDKLISDLSKNLDSLSGDSLVDAVNELEAKIESFKLKIELINSTQSSHLDSTSDMIGHEFYHNWQWNNTPNSVLDTDFLIQENYDMLSGIFNAQILEAADNDFAFRFSQESSGPDKPQEKENQSSSSVSYNGFTDEALPMSMWAPNLSHFKIGY